MQDTSHPNVIAVPSDRMWFDPRALLANTQYVFTDVLCTLNITRVLIASNVRRWGIGIARAPSAGTINYGPWPDPDLFVAGAGGISDSFPFFTLFNHGVIVCNAWSILSATTQTVRVVELIRN